MPADTPSATALDTLIPPETFERLLQVAPARACHVARALLCDEFGSMRNMDDLIADERTFPIVVMLHDRLFSLLQEADEQCAHIIALGEGGACDLTLDELRAEILRLPSLLVPPVRIALLMAEALPERFGSTEKDLSESLSLLKDFPRGELPFTATVSCAAVGREVASLLSNLGTCAHARSDARSRSSLADPPACPYRLNERAIAAVDNHRIWTRARLEELCAHSRVCFAMIDLLPICERMDLVPFQYHTGTFETKVPADTTDSLYIDLFELIGDGARIPLVVALPDDDTPHLDIYDKGTLRKMLAWIAERFPLAEGDERWSWLRDRWRALLGGIELGEGYVGEVDIFPSGMELMGVSKGDDLLVLGNGEHWELWKKSELERISSQISDEDLDELFRD
jgi:hypothetical protein